jgi:hypothetical protein
MPEGPIEGLERAWAGAKLVSGVVARLALPSGKPGWDMTEPRTKGEMAGMPERTPERPMDPRALTALGEVLRKKDGYDDRIMKRCRMSRIFGFRVTRELTTTGPARSAELEIVMDLQCAKLFVVREGAPGEEARRARVPLRPAARGRGHARPRALPRGQRPPSAMKCRYLQPASSESRMAFTPSSYLSISCPTPASTS